MAVTAQRAAQPSDDDREIRVLKLSVALYLVVIALKLAAYFYTGVMALMAEALHTLSDIFVSGFLLIAASASRKKADSVHMFGYGRAQYVGALVAATLFVSFTSLELYREAIPKLFQHEAAAFTNIPVAIAVLVVSMLVAIVPMVSLLRQEKRGAAAKAQLLELINDQLGLLAALAGTVLLLFGFPIADPLASIAVATVIGVNGVKLFRENLSYLLGRSPGAEFMAKVAATVNGVDGVLGAHGLRGEYVGPDALNLDLHVEVRKGMSIEEANRIAHEVASRVDELTSGLDFVAVHVDPEDAHLSVKPRLAGPPASRSEPEET
jgi:cation diffusion facilitator family transporter